MKSQAISIDAPIGGWNTFDSLDNMPPDAAIILDNLIPSAGTVDTRKGTLVYGDTLTGKPVETVASLDTNLVSRLVVCSGGGMWDMTDSSPLLPTIQTFGMHPEGTFTNNRWQTINFRGLAEEGVLVMCNGADPAQKYIAPYTTTVDIDFTQEDPNDPEQQIPLDGDFIGVEVFKGRTYYWYDNDDSFWYAQAGGYQGELKEFPMGSIVQRGGKIVLISTWTQQDSGDGKDDFLVIVFSTGEIIIYQGDDPESIGFFEMVGRYITAEPLGIRGVDKYGSDIIIMTKDGYIALSTIVQQGRISDVPAFSRLITDAIKEATSNTYLTYGWDATLFAKEGLFIFNVPDTQTTFVQHVLNTVTQRWCRFTDIDVNCMVVHNERLFGGTNDGKVLSMMEGTSDAGDPIYFTALPAFNYFGDGGNHKMITAAQIISTHSNPELIDLRGYADFNYPTILPEIPVYVSTGDGVWSIEPAQPAASVGSYWDEDFWALGSSFFSTQGWQNLSAFGYAVSVMVRFAKINEGVRWRSTGIRFNKAGAQ